VLAAGDFGASATVVSAASVPVAFVPAALVRFDSRRSDVHFEVTAKAVKVWVNHMYSLVA
jgi:hypothetical protein